MKSFFSGIVIGSQLVFVGPPLFHSVKDRWFKSEPLAVVDHCYGSHYEDGSTFIVKVTGVEKDTVSYAMLTHGHFYNDSFNHDDLSYFRKLYPQEIAQQEACKAAEVEYL